MFDTIFSNASLPTELSISISSALISISVALVLGILICVSYLFSTKKRERSASFILSLIILPSIVAVVILLIGGNLARAFSMAGIFTIVRFRSVPGDSKDISYVFLTMAAGLAAGLGYLTLGAVITVIICIIIVLINKLHIGEARQKEMRLKITVPEDMNFEGAFDDLFAKYTDYYEMQKVKTTNMGALYELHYDLIMKNGGSAKEFLDALRCRNGNLSIQLGVRESNSQQL